MNFGKIDQWILFGGGQLLTELSLKLKEQRFKVFVVTSDRHSSEFISISEKITLREFLIGNDIDFLVSEDVNNDSDVISRISKNTLGVSLGAAWIFKADFIKLFEGKLVNLHGTRLPQDRGGGGFSWRILRNERLGISLIHQIDPGIDTGNIIKYKEYFYPQSCIIPMDYQFYSKEQYILLLDEFIDDILACRNFDTIAQQEYFCTYWPRLFTDVHGYIDWSWKLKDLESFIHAFDDPYNGASTFIQGIKVRLKKCFTSINDGAFHPFQKGMVYKISKYAVFVASEGGSLIIRNISDENNTEIINKIKVGDRFYTPFKYLEEAKQFRAAYTPTGIKQ